MTNREIINSATDKELTGLLTDMIMYRDGEVIDALREGNGLAKDITLDWASYRIICDNLLDWLQETAKEDWLHDPEDTEDERVEDR